MKVKSLFLVFFCCAFFYGYSQEFSIGIKGGVNYSTIGDLYHHGNDSGLGTNVTPNDDTVFSAEKDLGTNFGVFALIDYERFYLKPEMVFTSLKNTFPLAYKDAEWTATRIDFPILFGYKFYNNFSVYAGPGFSIISDMELTGPEQPITYDDSSINLNIGVAANFGIVGIDVRYQYGISKVDEQRVDIDRGIYGTNIADLLEYNTGVFSVNVQLNIINFNSLRSSRGSKSGWRNHKNL